MKEQGERMSERRDVDGRSRHADAGQSSSPDRILSAVANQERRAVLDSLQRAPEQTVEVDALANSVAVEVATESGEEVSDDRRRRLRIALHQVHLPKLEESGTIDYDAQARQVRYVGGDLESELASLLGSNDVDE